MRDHAIVTHQLMRDLMMKMPALVGDMQMSLRETPHRLLAAIAPLLLASDRALRASKRLLCVAVVTRRSDLMPIRCHQEGFQPKVNPGGRQWRRCYLDIGQFAGEDNVPAIGFALEGDRLDRA